MTRIFSFIFLMLLSGTSIASAQEVVALWAGPAPKSTGNAPTDIPSLTAFFPDKPTGPTSAVVICPGGGYYVLAWDREGINVAKYFQERGVAAFVLRYRLPSQGYRHPVPLLDAQRAMRLIRSHATDWKIDPKKVGVLGFSAGGHVASTLETHFDAGHPQATDPVDKFSCRPDFAVLVYAVISMKDGLTNEGSKNILLGPNPDPGLVENLSNETQVTAQTPPTYLAHSVDDGIVPIASSRLMFASLQKAGVPTALQEYPYSGHGWGFGTTPDHSVLGGWLDKAFDWLKERGLMPDSPPYEGTLMQVAKTAKYSAGWVWSVHVLDLSDLPNPGSDEQGTKLWCYLYQSRLTPGAAPAHDGKYGFMSFLDHNGWWSAADCSSRIEWSGSISGPPPPRVLQMWGVMPVLGWQSPISGTVDIELLVNKSKPDPGIAKVSLESSDGAVLWSHVYDGAHMKGETVRLTNVKVSKGGRLFLINEGTAAQVLVPTFTITVDSNK